MQKKVLITVTLLLLAAVSLSQADVVTLSVHRLGDDDAGAAAGNTGNALTTDGGGQKDLSINDAPAYSSDTPFTSSTLSMNFDGVNDYYTGSASPTTVTDNCGMEAWVKATAAGSAGFSFVASNGSPGNQGWGILEIGGTWRIIHMGVAGSGAGPAVEPGTWTHLAMIRENGVSTLYVDGTATDVTLDSVPATPNNAFSIGANHLRTTEGNPVFEGYFNGLIDSVRVFVFEPGQFDPATDLSYETEKPGPTVATADPSEAVVSEKGLTGTVDVSLNSQPSADVTVTLSPASAGGADPNDIILNGAVAGASIDLVFTSENFDTPKTVTVSANDDDVSEVAEMAYIVGATTSSDANFDGGFVPTIAVEVIDNDSSGISFVDGKDEFELAEAGVSERLEEDTFSCSLLVAPTDDVMIDVLEFTPNPAGDPNDTIISPVTLIFTPSNWDTPQTVTVTAIDDELQPEGHPEIVEIELVMTSDDLAYDGLNVKPSGDIVVSLFDNDCGSAPFLIADFNQDCIVNMGDFALFAAQWLACSETGCP